MKSCAGNVKVNSLSYWERSAYMFPAFASKSCLGLAHAYSWRFKRLDARRKSLLGKGVGADSYTGIDYHNLGLSCQKCLPHKRGVLKRLVLKDAEKDASASEAEEDEAPVAELNSTTRMWNGWRISFVKDQTNKVVKRRRHLSEAFKANATMSSSLPQGLRHRPSDQRMEGALQSQAHRKTCRERLRLGLTKAPKAPEPKAPEPEAPRPRFEIGGSSSSTA